MRIFVNQKSIEVPVDRVRLAWRVYSWIKNSTIFAVKMDQQRYWANEATYGRYALCSISKRRTELDKYL